MFPHVILPGFGGFGGMTSEFEFFSKVYVVTGMNKSQYIFKNIEICNFQTNPLSSPNSAVIK